MFGLTRNEKLYAAWCLAAIAIGVLVWIWALTSSGSRSTTPIEWPQTTRTFLTTQAGDAFLTTAVVHPEDLDRTP